MSQFGPQIELKSPKKVLSFIWENLELGICLVSMIGMTILTFSQVIARYVFDNSFSWTEEVTRYLMIWLTFGGSAYAFRMGAHIGVEALVEKLSPRGKYIIIIVSSLATIVFFFFLGYYGWEHTYQQYLNNQVAPVTRIPIAVPYSAVPVGSFLVILRLIAMLFQHIKNGVKEG